MASSKEATAQNGETVAGKVKLDGEALKDAIKKQVLLSLGRFSVLSFSSLDVTTFFPTCDVL